MANTCEICGKHPMAGRMVSHAHNVTPRVFAPNLRTIKVTEKGRSRRKKVCMKCLKSMGKT